MRIINRLHINVLLVIILFLHGLLLTACSSGGGGTSSAPTVARVEIKQTGLMLTGIGASKQLAATAYDAQGNVLTVPITWNSTTVADIGVDTTGKVTANSANGSSQIVAEVNGIKSAPLLVVVTVPPVGAILLTDAQIVGDPVETDPNALPSFDNTYKVVLSGVSAPAIGALLINTESKPVAGRVVAVDTAGGQTTVTLGLVSIREAFPNLNINQVIDLSQAPVTINPDIAAAYDVQRTGNTFNFTPKTTARPLGKATGKGAALAVPAPPPFSKCDASITSADLMPIAPSAPPLFSVTQNFSLDLVYTAAAGLERFVVKGEVSPKFEIGLVVTAAFEGKIECTAELFAIRIPVGGPLSIFVAGLIPVEVGFEESGKVTVATASVGLKADAKASAEIGIACPNGVNCEFVRSVTGEAKAEPVWHLPSLGDGRFEPAVGVFGRIKLAIGNPLLKKLRFNAFQFQTGPKMQGSFATQASQIIDTGYKSDYKVSFENKAGVDLDLGSALKLLGLASINALELVSTVDIAKSPVGAVTGAVTADRASFVSGDTVNFSVKLNPATVDFFPVIGPYNVNRVLLARLTGGALVATDVGSVIASSGQTDFTIPFTATDSGTASEFTAFVVSTLLPFDIFSLEVGSPSPAQKIAFTSARDGIKYQIYVMNADGSGQTRLTNDSFSDTSPEWSPDGTRIAFDSSLGSSADIYVMNADGSGQTRLTNNPPGNLDYDPAWSPDGARIAFLGTRDQNNDIYVMNADGSGQTRLTNNPLWDTDPAWSPDGARIAFSSARDGNSEIYVMNADGSGQTRLTNSLYSDDPAWSPDGTRIAFIRNSNIYVMNADGSGQTQLTTLSGLYPSWSPDGARIAFSSRRDGNAEIYVMNADGSGQTRLTNNTTDDIEPAWSP